MPWNSCTNMQPSIWKESMLCIRRMITAVFGRRGKQSCLKTSGCMYDLSQRSVTRYSPWIRGASHRHWGILMKRMKFSSCLNQKLTCIIFFFPWLLLPASAILKYLGPKQEQISGGKKAINIANSSQHIFVSWKAWTRQEVLCTATRWLCNFEIMAPGAQSLQSHFLRHQRTPGLCQSSLREAGLAGRRPPLRDWGALGSVGSLSDPARIWTRLRKSVFIDGLCSPGDFLLMARPEVVLSAQETWPFVCFSTKWSQTDTSLLHPRSGQLRRDRGFSEMQEHAIVKKGWIKEDLFHLILVPKFPTSLTNKSEAI